MSTPGRWIQPKTTVPEPTADAATMSTPDETIILELRIAKPSVESSPPDGTVSPPDGTVSPQEEDTPCNG